MVAAQVERLEAALPLYQRMLGTHPQVAELLDRCAKLVLRQGRVDEADQMAYQAELMRTALRQVTVEAGARPQVLQRKFCD